MKTVAVTGRLSIVEFEIGDEPLVLHVLNDAAFIEHIGDRGVRSPEDARAYLERGPFADYQRQGYGLFKVVLRDGDVPIGMCGLLRRDELPGPDVGYALLPAYRSAGYASEAVQAMLGFARGRGLEAVYAIVSFGNAKSIGLLHRAGFADDGTIELRGETLRLLSIRTGPGR